MPKRRTENQRVKDAQALELRRAGASYDQIAKQLGYSNKSGAHHAVQRSMAEAMAVRNVAVEEMIELENQRLDALLVAIWPAAIKGQWLATDRALKIMERRAAMNGLDAPKRQEITGAGGNAIQIEHDINVTLTDEQRMERISWLVESRREEATRPLALPGPDLDTTEGGSEQSMA